MIFTCSIEQTPCPDANQVVVVSPTIEEFAQLGITPQSTATAFGVGFGLVFFFACLGLAISTAIKTINKA